MEKLYKLSNWLRSFSSYLHDPKGQLDRLNAGPFRFQPLAYLVGGLVIFLIAYFRFFILVRKAFSTATLDGSQLLQYILVPLVLIFSTASVLLALYLQPPTTAKNFRDRRSWQRRVEQTKKNMKLFSAFYMAISASMALGLLLYQVENDQVNFYSNLYQVLMASDNDNTVYKIYRASRHCDQTYGLNDPFCSKISSILGIEIAYQGDIRINKNAIQICSGKANFSGDISDGFMDLISVCKSFDRIETSNISSRKIPWILLIQIFSAYSICFFIGVALAEGLFDRFYDEKLKFFCKIN